jgi:hypothetical protein
MAKDKPTPKDKSKDRSKRVATRNDDEELDQDETPTAASASSPGGAASNATRLTTLEKAVDLLTNKVTHNSTNIAANLRLIKKEKLEREMENLKGKFVVRGYEWTKATFAGRENSSRRKYIRLLAKVVSVDSGLMSHEDWKEVDFPDCKPVFWDQYATFDEKLSTPLCIQFSHMALWHGIKGALSGKRDLIHPIREALPRILDKMYDDALKHRRTLLDAAGGAGHTLYVDIKPSEPYIQLMEKTFVSGQQVRSVVNVEWSDARFKDPVANHDDYRAVPRTDGPGAWGRAPRRGPRAPRTDRGAGRSSSRGRNEGMDMS